MPRRQTLKRMRSNAGLMIGVSIVLAFAVVAVGAPLIAPPTGDSAYLIPQDGFKIYPEPPRSDHPLGTLAGRYDIFYGLVWGTRVAFWVGLVITLGRVLIGVPIGLVSGYNGGLLDAFIMRITDAFMAFPVMAAVMVVVAIFSDPWRGLYTPIQPALTNLIEPHIILALVLCGWMPYARLMRGNVLAERDKEYVQAVTSIGAKGRRVLFRHVFPNATQGLLVLITSDIGTMVALVAMFSFLGLAHGIRGLTLAHWGEMLSLSREWIITPSRAFEYWYTYLPPSLAIVLFSAGWNLIGDGLRDVMDPRLTGSRV